MDDLRFLILPPFAAFLGCLVLRFSGRDVADAARTVLWIACLAWLIPHALALLWCFPCLDDWTYGAGGRADWWGTQWGYYRQWTGRVAATAVLSGWGLIGTPQMAVLIGYPLVLIASIAALVAGVHMVVRAVGGTALHTVALLTAFTLGMPAPVEGLYWLAGTVTYQGGVACTLIASALLLRGRPFAAVAPCLLAPLFAETVLVLAVPILLVLAARLRRGWLPALAVLAGAAISLASPGNHEHRLAAIGEIPPPPPWTAVTFVVAALRAGYAGLSASTWWALLPLVAVVALDRRVRVFVPPLWLPIAAGAAIALAVAAPQVWTAMGSPRADNPGWMGLCFAGAGLAMALGHRRWLLLPLLLALWLGDSPAPWVALGLWTVAAGGAWLLLRQRVSRGDLPAVVAALLAAAMVLGSPHWSAAVVDAAIDGPAYAQAQRQRMSRLAAAAPGALVIVPELPVRPRTFHREDLHIATDTWQNHGCAAFFGLKGVRTRPVRPVSAAETDLSGSAR